MGPEGSPRDTHEGTAGAAPTVGAIYERFSHSHPWAGSPETIRATLTLEQFKLLTEKMYLRLTEDRKALTIAMANGMGIGMGGQKAYDAWLAADRPKGDAGVKRQAQAIARLRHLFGSQPNALRDSIKVKAH